MSKRCYGCGVKLQDSDKDKPGYTNDINKSEHVLCYRCYRLKHHNEFIEEVIDNKQVIDILKTNIKKKHLVVLIIDLFDIVGSINDELLDIIKHNEVLVVANKRDLMLKSLNDRKIKDYLKSLFNKKQIKLVDVLITSAVKKQNIDELVDLIFTYYKHQDVYVCGMSNVGKSSIINALIASFTKSDYQILVSRYAGTTMDAIKVDLDDAQLYDLPGLNNLGSMYNYINEIDYKYLNNKKEVKNRMYQLNAEQTLFIGGLVAFNFIEGTKTGFNCFFNNLIEIHRTKYENAQALFDNHLEDDLLVPKALNVSEYQDLVEHKIDLSKREGKVSLAIAGLGWISVYATDQIISVMVPKGVDLKVIKAIV